MKKYINKSNALFLIALSSSFSVMSSQSDPDSVGMNLDMHINVSHKVNGVMIGDNPLVNITYGAWGTWETSSYMVDCTPWSPEASTVKWGQEFIQTTHCIADETRERSVTYHYQNGDSSTETEYQTERNKLTDEQDAIGTKNYVLRESQSEGAWNPNGNKYACSSYLPSTSTVSKGTVFQQKQKCLQNYVRKVYTYEHWANGDRTVKKTQTETKTEDHYSYRNAVGTKAVNLKWVLTHKSDRFSMPHCMHTAPKYEGNSCTNYGATTREIQVIGQSHEHRVCYYVYRYYQCKSQ